MDAIGIKYMIDHLHDWSLLQTPRSASIRRVYRGGAVRLPWCYGIMAHHYEAVENRIDDRIQRVAVGCIIIIKQDFNLFAL